MEKRKDINYFDGLDEVYVEPMKDGIPMYNIKKAYEYCKKNNLDIEKISEKQLEPFLTGYYKDNNRGFRDMLF